MKLNKARTYRNPAARKLLTYTSLKYESSKLDTGKRGMVTLARSAKFVHNSNFKSPNKI